MRREWIARRKRQQRIRGMITIAAFMIGMIAVFGVFGMSTNARSIHDHPEYKYFMSYELEYGDSLWTIAEEHADEHYMSMDEYIDEVCIINSISEESQLIAGTNLIIPYYSQEFKQ